MSIGSIILVLGTDERALDVNSLLLRDEEISKHCTVVYINETMIRIDTQWPRICLEWLIAQEIVDPTKDNYIVEDSTDGN